MNPSSVIVLQAYNQDELFTNGFAEIGFKLLTPFENWKETSFFSGSVGKDFNILSFFLRRVR